MPLPAEIDVLVVGAGQAGLGVDYWLRKRTALSAVIVAAAPRLGHSWRQRRDGLVLFTPRRFSALPGGRFPRGASAYPTKGETAAYLAAYTREHDLPVRLDTRVQRLVQDGAGFVATTSRGLVRARAVVLAPGPYSSPYIPDAGAVLDADVRQVHSAQYRRSTDIPRPDVVVVGGGNSAAQLAVELAATHRVTVVASQPTWFLPARILGVSLYWWIYLTGILNSPADSRVSKLVRKRGDGIIGRELQRLVADGRVRMLTSRVVGRRARRCSSRTAAGFPRAASCGAPASARTSAGWTCRARSTPKGAPSTGQASRRSRDFTGSGCRGRRV